MSSRPELRLDWCSHEAAKYACEKWHYSQTVPVGKLVRVGVWEHKRFIGCVLFSCGSAGVGVIGKSLGISAIETAELARVALSQHSHPVSKIVSIAMRMLRKQSTRLRLIVSYADPEQKHIGVIYQAGNWVCTGRSSPDVAYIDYSGKRWHSRSVSKTGYKTRLGKKTVAPSPDGMKQINLQPKHRYLMPLDEDMRRKIEPLRKPYPKRVTSADSGTPGDQSGGGGASPTVTLSKQRGNRGKTRAKA